jgi:hypothetical protein
MSTRRREPKILTRLLCTVSYIKGVTARFVANIGDEIANCAPAFYHGNGAAPCDAFSHKRTLSTSAWPNWPRN